MGAGICLMVVLLLAVSAAAPEAKNYVNWKGGFWLEFPDDWEKIDYRVVDRYLAASDTSRDIFNYEAVFAPLSPGYFIEDAYLVITFDSTGELNSKQIDSVLTAIAESYSTSIQEAPIVRYMSDLIPGRPQIDRDRKAVMVLSEMAYQPEAMKKLWLYMQINDVGLISLYFYSQDSTFERNRPVFESIVESLSFENLNEASQQELVFTDVTGGGEGSEFDSETGSDENGGVGIVPYLALILIVLYLLWRFAVAPRLRKNKNRPE